jgi:hypothetical protein
MIFSQVKLANSTVGSLTGWTNLANITTDDGVLAVSSTVGHNSNAPYLKLSDFQFEIPAEATIVGVVCRVEGKNENAYNTGFFAAAGGLKLLSIANTAKGMAAFTANTLATKIVGGDADLWGASEITPVQVNEAAFGVYALFRNGNVTPQKMSIDKVELEVFYTMPEPDPFTGHGTPPNP